MHYRRLLLSLGLILLFNAGFAAAPDPYPGLARNWHYYQSPSFELYSANGERDSRDVLEKMEQLRALAAQEFGLQTRIPRRVTIYYFDKETDFNAYSPAGRQRWTGFVGYSYAYPDRMILVMVSSGKRKWDQQLAYRQSVGFLYQMADQSPPDWFQIALAELLSTLKEDRNEMILGGVVPRHVDMLKANGVDTIWQAFARSPQAVGLMAIGQRQFYDAACWAALHYCMFKEGTLPPEERAQLLDFASHEFSRNRPRTFERAVLARLAPGATDLTAEIEHYVKSGRFATRRIARPSLPDVASYPKRPVGIDEMRTQLAELGYRANQAPYGGFRMQDMLESNPSLELYELFGGVAWKEGKLDKVKEYWGRAVELGTVNVGVLNGLCRVEGGIVFETLDLRFRLPEARATRLRELLRKSIAAAPAQRTAYQMLLWVEAYAAVPDAANEALALQHLGPWLDTGDVLVPRALCHYYRNNPGEALRLLEQVHDDRVTTWIAAWAEVIRANIEKRPARPEILKRTPNRD